MKKCRTRWDSRSPFLLRSTVSFKSVIADIILELLSKGSVAIVSVLKDRQNYGEYRLAQESFKCYAIHHNYPWLVVDLSANDTLQKLCPQKDVSCFAANLLCLISDRIVVYADHT